MNTRTPALALVALFAVAATGCYSAEAVLPGDWSASDGGGLMLADDGTGWTDGTYFVEKFCMSNDGGITEFGIDWLVQDDPEVVADNFAWLPDAEAQEQFEQEFGCTISEGMFEEPILSVSANQVEFGYDALFLEQTFQVLTRR